MKARVLFCPGASVTLPPLPWIAVFPLQAVLWLNLASLTILTFWPLGFWSPVYLSQ